jgi:hypothetical protein
MLSSAGGYRIAPPETEKAMNYYLASQLVTERQAALVADATRRAQIREARAARNTSAAAGQPARTRRPLFARFVHASA